MDPASDTKLAGDARSNNETWSSTRLSLSAKRAARTSKPAPATKRLADDEEGGSYCTVMGGKARAPQHANANAQTR
jgi:hypothetical protein